MIKKTLLTSVIVFLLATSTYSYDWNKGVKIFKLNMSILNVEKVLVKHYPPFKFASSYYSNNFYLLTANHTKTTMLYYNSPSINIDQHSNGVNESLSGRVTLKRIFGYKIGKLTWLDNSKILSSSSSENKQQYKLTLNTLNNKLHNKVRSILHKNIAKSTITKEGNIFTINNLTMTKAKELVKSLGKNINKVTIEKDFTPRIVYNYRKFPIEKFNPLVKSVELGFIDKSLFRIMYDISLSIQEYKVFKESINNNYAKYKKTFGKLKNIVYYQNDKQVIKLVSKQSNNKNYNVQLTYIQKDKYNQLKDYKFKSKTMLSKLIRESKYKHVDMF
jgi:hypothetical protein